MDSVSPTVAIGVGAEVRHPEHVHDREHRLEDHLEDHRHGQQHDGPPDRPLGVVLPRPAHRLAHRCPEGGSARPGQDLRGVRHGGRKIPQAVGFHSSGSKTSSISLPKIVAIEKARGKLGS